METKKNSKFYIVFGLILFASFGFIAIATMDYQSYHEVSYPNNNLALPDLTGKTEITTGTFLIAQDTLGGQITYNKINGIISINGVFSTTINGFIELNNIEHGKYIYDIIKISGTISGWGNVIRHNLYIPTLNQIATQNSEYITLNITTSNPYINLQLGSTEENVIYTNYQFKIQLSKGSYLLPYVVPKETIVYQHNQDYSALTEIGSVAITSLTAFINGFKVVGDILQTLVQFQQTVVYEISKFLIENYLKVIDFLESITDNGLIEWIKDPMKGFKF